MKETINFIRCNIRQLLELILITCGPIIPHIIDLPDFFKEYLHDTPNSLKDVCIHYVLMNSKNISSIVIIALLILAVRRINISFVMNRIYIYHDYPYIWYWICAKILGIKNCNLIQVPIYTQIKLVIQATFEKYPIDESQYIKIDKEECKVFITNNKKTTKEINLVLADTYEIRTSQIPKDKIHNTTILIRHESNSMSRRYSTDYIETVTNHVRKLEPNSIINLFATTNPMNTKTLAESVFGLSSRGNIEHLYVYQQENKGNRLFIKKHRIF